MVVLSCGIEPARDVERELDRALEETPPPPTIPAPRGALPGGPVGLLERTQYAGLDYSTVGRGFLLRLPDGDVVGVTTAHSLTFRNAPAPLQRIALGVASQPDLMIEFDTLQGEPGQARSGEDMTVDYVLLRVPIGRVIDPDLILTPDGRGAPQPGERVSLFSGTTDEAGRRRVYAGTVHSVNDMAVWVLMDDVFDPSGLSGSPFLSQFTGQVVGMAIAVNRHAGRVLLGLHPIGSIVRLAQVAKTFPKIAEYRR